MSHQVIWRWEQDGSGGDHGTATYFPGTVNEVKVVLPCFKDANNLQMSIEAALRQARHDGRFLLLNEIGRIQP